MCIRDSSQGALDYGALGGATGAALPGVFRGIGSTGRYVRDKTYGFSDPERVTEHASRKMDDLLGARDETIVQQLMKQDAAPPGGIAADQSDMLQSQLATLVSRAGSTANLAKDFVTERIVQQFPRFENFFTKALDGVPLTDARQAIQTATKLQADPLYQAVKQMDFDADDANAMRALYARNRKAVKQTKELSLIHISEPTRPY